MDDFKEEKNYLDQVILNIEDKIKNTNLTTERLRKEVENIGVPNWDERKYFQNCKNKIYSLGDAITVRVARANLEKKQLDFELIEK